MSTEAIALIASLIAIGGQVANAYLKVSILKELAERETLLRKDIDEKYVRRDVCRQLLGGCS